MGVPRILAADHPLAGMFSVGPDAPADLRADSAAVLGVAIGDHVHCRFRGDKRAVVVRLNPADLELAIEVRGSVGRMLWCRRDEVETAARARGHAIGEVAA
ncbi:MAG: hypothetical protein M0Z46_06545 [Actinomycetota bacterium]|jgi:hypothetical protein|nr:hypothetical protein [Actinomycetota bacterium]MDA8358957.1 hypothetical protein [Actinomycetota bacterium]